MSLTLTDGEQQLIEPVAKLAQERFSPRANDYDRRAVFPAEDFADLIGAGLHAPAVPGEFGGLGLGRRSGLFTLWMMTKELAKADMSLARCWEGHVNSQILIDGIASDDQKRKWFPGIVDEGHIWVSWSGEPQSPTPEQRGRIGTLIEEVRDGYLVSGSKVFATSAGHANWAILLVNTMGPGGARHASNAPDGLLLLACDLADPSVEFDDSWWDPIGMRATVSHHVRFNGTFIPRENQIGGPGRYLRENWQTLFSPHYGATFLGGAEAALLYALDYLRRQNKVHDPYVQHHVARMAMNVETIHLWLRRVAGLWQDGCTTEAQEAGARVRYLAERLAMETLDDCIRACGARCLNRPSPIERIYRDLSFYVRHDNADHVLAAIGQAVLGQPHDVSFFNPGGSS